VPSELGDNGIMEGGVRRPEEPQASPQIRTGEWNWGVSPVTSFHAPECCIVIGVVYPSSLEPQS